MKTSHETTTTTTQPLTATIGALRGVIAQLRLFGNHSAADDLDRHFFPAPFVESWTDSSGTAWVALTSFECEAAVIRVRETGAVTVRAWAPTYTVDAGADMLLRLRLGSDCCGDALLLSAGWLAGFADRASRAADISELSDIQQEMLEGWREAECDDSESYEEFLDDVSCDVEAAGHLPVDTCVAFMDGRLEVYVVLHEWAPNGAEMQSPPLTPEEARALAAELLRAADATLPTVTP
jgi:hypothetical protein